MSDTHGFGSAVRRPGIARRALVIALALNAVFMVVEVAGGIAFDSLALVADAAHMLTDVAGLTVALIALALMSRGPSARHTFGLQRAEVLAAQVNGVLLLLASGWIVVEATRRISSPHPVVGAGMLLVAGAGLAVNLVSAWMLAREQRRSLNLRGAYLHMVSDAAGSAGAVVAGIAIVRWGSNADWVDPAVSIGIALLVAWAAWRLIRETTHVLLEGSPAAISVDAVDHAIRAVHGVGGLHDLHVWTLASDVPALSCHVRVAGDMELHDAQARGDEIKHMLAERFGIQHITLELECHECTRDFVEAPDAGSPSRTS